MRNESATLPATRRIVPLKLRDGKALDRRHRCRAHSDGAPLDEQAVCAPLARSADTGRIQATSSAQASVCRNRGFQEVCRAQRVSVDIRSISPARHRAHGKQGTKAAFCCEPAHSREETWCAVRRRLIDEASAYCVCRREVLCGGRDRQAALHRIGSKSFPTLAKDIPPAALNSRSTSGPV